MNITNGNKIVIKIEYSTLSNSDGKLNLERMEKLAMIISNLHNSGKHILLVTSGAIALGTIKLNMDKPPKDFIDKQAISAIGQAELIKIYQNYFEAYNQRVAQVLLTKDVMENEVRMINAQNTFNTLLDMNIIPIINENDVVSTDDIELDDNYPLTLNVASLSQANMIIIKPEKEGEYYLVLRGDKHAKLIDNEEKLIEIVEEHIRIIENKEDFTRRDFPPYFKDIIFS